MEIRDGIKLIMKSNRMTILRASEEMGVDPSTVHRMLNRNLSVGKLIGLCKAIGCEIVIRSKDTEVVIDGLNQEVDS